MIYHKRKKLQEQLKRFQVYTRSIEKELEMFDVDDKRIRAWWDQRNGRPRCNICGGYIFPREWVKTHNYYGIAHYDYDD